jgi:pyruvate/2-oxoglutarate dehydrogenase complex dihydrolipoamide acyltransferase (E2) component
MAGMREKRPSHISLAEPVFPYFISQENTNPTSFITISVADRYEATDRFDLVDPTLFYVAGADLNSRGGNNYGDTSSEYQVELRHSFASDEEADTAYIAIFTLKSIQIARSGPHSVNYTAWLTGVRFYPAGYQDGIHEVFDPFVGAVEHEEVDGYENALYPYQPPVVMFADKFTLPVEVNIAVNHNFHDVPQVLAERQAAHEKAREERDVKRAAEAQAEAERKATRKAEHEAWLLTEDGQQYALDRNLTLRIREIPKNETATEEELNAVTAEANEFFSALTEQEVTWHKTIQEDRMWTVNKANPSRVRFLETFDALVNGS